MIPVVTLTSPSDTIVMSGDPRAGFVYNDSTLDAWYVLAEVDAGLNKRPNAHGTYAPDQLFVNEARPIVNGQFYGSSTADALVARQRLTAMYNDGRPVTMSVEDDLGTTTREVWVVEVAPDFRWGHTHFSFDMVAVAPDPRRYGPSVESEDGMPVGSSGLTWPLGTAPSGLYWDWGTPGTLGQVAFTNAGAATTLPVLHVGGAGGFDVGFRVTEIETGRELTLMRATGTGDTIILDSRTERATLNGGDVTGAMTRRQWFAIPSGETRRYQITPLGSVTGAPTIRLVAAIAYL